MFIFVFQIGQAIQALDYPCGMWRDGVIKAKDEKKADISFSGIAVKEFKGIPG